MTRRAYHPSELPEHLKVAIKDACHPLARPSFLDEIELHARAASAPTVTFAPTEMVVRLLDYVRALEKALWDEGSFW